MTEYTAREGEAWGQPGEAYDLEGVVGVSLQQVVQRRTVKGGRDMGVDHPSRHRPAEEEGDGGSHHATDGHAEKTGDDAEAETRRQIQHRDRQEEDDAKRVDYGKEDRAADGV